MDYESSGKLYARPEQLLSDHSANVSELASLFGSKCKLRELLAIAGYYHDYGKASLEFQKYLFDDNAKRGDIVHSIYGAIQTYKNSQFFLPAAEVLGNIIAAHHGELYDNLSPDGSTPLLDRIQATMEIVVSNDMFPVINADLFKTEFQTTMSNAPDTEKAFFIAMLTKYAYSCLVDADRLDAYLFTIKKQYSEVTPDWDQYISKLEKSLAGFDVPTAMGPLRQHVSSACAEAGLRVRGIYKLEVPTGGGKTLASMRFALEHARFHKLDRIIYVIPYLSILSQTAKEIRRVLDANDDIILEHHSDFLPDDPLYYKLQTDRWEAPIIITTQVQFLESIFSAKGSGLRKLHNMSRSVIIFDEIQSLPVKCVHLFNGAINFLHYFCNSTILLCSATQPLLDKAQRKIMLSPNPSIVECSSPPERYRIISAMIPGGYSYAELASFIVEKHESSTLVIVNTKAAAKHVFEELRRNNMPALHLSTNMCSAHREDVIDEVRKRLASKEPVICVSTQLIEAGVDISFACVIRDLAGLDSIYQAAGRCNRHGEFNDIKSVYVVDIKGENLEKLQDIKKGAEISRMLFADSRIDINEYYRHYFHERRNEMDYPIGRSKSIYDLLSSNQCGRDAYNGRKDKQGIKPPSLVSAIRSAADEFYVIERGRTEVVVPYKESEEYVSQYFTATDDQKKRELLRKLAKYSVSLYRYQIDSLRSSGALDDTAEIIRIERGFYNEERGVDIEGKHEFLNV